eukprot:836655-Rhodomonas_salina.3
MSGSSLATLPTQTTRPLSAPGKSAARHFLLSEWLPNPGRGRRELHRNAGERRCWLFNTDQRARRVRGPRPADRCSRRRHSREQLSRDSRAEIAPASKQDRASLSL